MKKLFSLISAITIIGSGANTTVYGLNHHKTKLHRESNGQVHDGIDIGVNGASYSTFGDDPNTLTGPQHGAMLRINLSGPAYTVFEQLASQISLGSNPNDVGEFLDFLFYNAKPEFAFKVPGWLAATKEIKQTILKLQEDLRYGSGIPTKQFDVISQIYDYLKKRVDGNLDNWEHFVKRFIESPDSERAFVKTFPSDIPPGNYHDDWNYFFQLHGASICIPVVNYGTSGSPDYRVYGDYIKVIPQYERYNLVADYTQFPVSDARTPVIPVKLAKTALPFSLANPANQVLVRKAILGFYNLPNQSLADIVPVNFPQQTFPVIKEFHQPTPVLINFNYVAEGTGKLTTYFETKILISIKKS